MHEQLIYLLRRWWWLVGTVALIATIAALAWTGSRSGSFQAEGTFLVQPRTIDEGDEVRAMEALIDTEGIPSTYANIAVSDLIDQRARTIIQLDGDDDAGVHATASVVSGTNLLRIGARGHDADVVTRMAEVVGELTVEYVAELNDVFALSALDAPRMPTATTGPDSGTITATALLAGLGLGLVAASAADRRFPTDSVPRVRKVRDPRSDAHDRGYFELRLREEISRSRSGDHMFCLGVLELTRTGRLTEEDAPVDLDDSDLRATVEVLASNMRGHDILGHLGDGRLAAILPGRDITEGRAVVAGWRDTVTNLLLDLQPGGDVAISVGVCAFESSAFIGDPVAERAARAL